MRIKHIFFVLLYFYNFSYSQYFIGWCYVFRSDSIIYNKDFNNDGFSENVKIVKTSAESGEYKVIS